MTRFVDGPAGGQVLMLKRAPYFLRAVMDRFGKWDALDQLEDKPGADELLFAYEIMEPPGWCFLDGPKCRGRYPVARYKLVDPQPTDLQMRDERAWVLWVEETAQARGLK